MSIVRINSLGITDGTIVNGDINASAGITLAKLSGVNDAKAWVNFNGTGTVAIRASFNVTSITDNGTGDYTVNITTALTDVNYSIVGSSGGQSSTTAGAVYLADQSTARTTSLFRVNIITTAGANVDTPQINIAVFR